MALSLAAVPDSIATKSGAAHRGKLARIGRQLNAAYSVRNFRLQARCLRGFHEVVITASDTYFGGLGAFDALRTAFLQAI